MLSPAELHPAVEPLAFLLGRWRGEGRGVYPTIQPFTYGEEIEFSHNGRPFIFYVQKTWNLTDGYPMHSEAGYLRPVSENGVELVLAQPQRDNGDPRRNANGIRPRNGEHPGRGQPDRQDRYGRETGSVGNRYHLELSGGHGGRRSRDEHPPRGPIRERSRWFLILRNSEAHWAEVVQSMRPIAVDGRLPSRNQHTTSFNLCPA